LLLLGFEREGEGRLEEDVRRRKEGLVPRIFLPDIRRDEAPNWGMETTHWRCFDRRFFGHLRFIVDVGFR
jgi:hypothetical protein